MNIRVIGFLFFMMSLVISTSDASEKSQVGKHYFLEINGEQLADGSQVYIRYDLTISASQKKAHIKLTSWHAPISCEGDYNVESKDGQYLLYYLGKPDACVYPSPQFYMMEKGKYTYIKGAPFVYDQGKWLRLSQGKK